MATSGFPDAWESLEDTYAVTQAVAVRRQAELDVRVRSLGQLPREVAEDAGRLSREFFVGMWVDPDDRDEIRRALTSHEANSAFDDPFAGRWATTSILRFPLTNSPP